MRSGSVQINPIIQQAIAAKKPVVALESTIIAHGMPYPTNMETALEVEAIIRAEGAIPATIGIIEGQMIVGLDEEQIRFFSTSPNILKAGERDFPAIISKKLNAATTAGATLSIATAAGIRVFVTGGIGGVGPTANEDLDISADLPAIAQYSCLTVCAGTKAFMDIPATLEYLETLRVPVLVYRSEYFPMFYSASSGVKIDWYMQAPEEVAAAFATKLQIGAEGGMLLGVPLPTEHALPEDVTRGAINVALERIKERGITGKAVTPFLLSAIKEETGGRSLEANIALIKNNAKVGAQIAVKLMQFLGH